jgi:IQ calmodulin-binding motif
VSLTFFVSFGRRELGLRARRYATRKVLFQRRQRQAATQIQRVWRGSCARARVDKLWLNNVVSRIQAIARGWLCKKKFTLKMDVEYDAAVMIQAMWRGHRVRCTQWFELSLLGRS